MKKVIVSFLAVIILAFIGCRSAETPVEMEPVDIGPLSKFNVPTGDKGPQIIEPGISYCGTPKTVDLFAGQYIDVGSVTIYNDQNNLYVTVYSQYGYQNTTEQIKMWVGADLSLMPRNSQGNPVAGQFPYKITTTGGTTYTLTIPLNELSLVNKCGDTINVVVHADVYARNSSGELTAETAFGGDLGGDTGTRWWYYTKYVIQCCQEPPVFDYEETAFLKFLKNQGGYVFASDRRANPENYPSLKLTKQRWGWAAFTGTTNWLNLYAGAGLNDTTKGMIVGLGKVEVNSGNVTIYLNVPGSVGPYTAKVKEVHFYVSDFKPTTIAPGQYGYSEYFGMNNPWNGNYQKTFSGVDANGDGKVWVIVHAVVAW